ncbi:hypothetical protein PE066_07605 [Ramlibacter tataouinensis]|uniref:hypothetical protein n=1 Tax=Ramlibacter tataouinensis TaxID=94132 RepID=UPI0022F3DC24|nr:hypothetical protein [Ramlibacter tataouinensis]WBY03386.1 hypothetical protein PE066_07605 [Ramlibacter tataouinensis]
MSAGSDRLERSRLAILEHIHRKELRRQGGPGDGHPEAAGTAGEAPRHRHSARPVWYASAQEVVEGWWKHHPAHMAVDLARPTLASYARRKPMQYLGLAALAGAALFFMRPWKLISVTGVLLALVKSPQMASVVMQALSTSRNPAGDEPQPG